MISLKKNKIFVLSGENTYNLKTQNYQVVSSRSKKEKFNIKETDKEYIVNYKGKEFVGEIIELKQNKCSVSINGNTYKFTIDTESSFQRKEKLSKNNLLKNNSQIIAPMPGKISEILISEGSAVEKGSPLLLLEAMKMQNQVLSAQSGIITKLLIHEGDNVMANQLLMEIG
ncbi:MAG: acetyl-CoA carboxylase biotin carboxyl carrier protein subunit [Marinifilum sp.]|jgi:biotin carboxyl carrier protein|nr:acetyl-CoA carboxylase biotin carboxyl carrier protein subunit [Marinifilum sp.]